MDKEHGYPFQLRPFASTREAKALSLGGWLARLPGILTVEYQLAGDLRNITWPAPGAGVTRRHELWRHTCFELFFAIPGQPAYWEINLGPDGSWNVYSFAAYRQGMREEAAIDQLPCQTWQKDGMFSLSCRIDTSRLCVDAREIAVAIAGVVVFADGATSHWAIEHPEVQPDFHSRQGFSLVLPGVTDPS
ncbi:MAG: DOMON-like domain-containing protein [Desulforhopalus sp.]|nr:DOMON-like domain-containing protein [Desulforhopalus sp.]